MKYQYARLKGNNIMIVQLIKIGFKNGKEKIIENAIVTDTTLFIKTLLSLLANEKDEDKFITISNNVINFSTVSYVTIDEKEIIHHNEIEIK